MSKPMYVVTALHSTGHGPSSSVVMVTTDPQRAFNRARTVEELAYEFSSGDGGDIHKVDLEVTYDHMPGSPTRPHLNPTNQDSLVFYRVMDRDWTAAQPSNTRVWREGFVNGFERVVKSEY